MHTNLKRGIIDIISLPPTTDIHIALGCYKNKKNKCMAENV
jgi:hypothetical protein